MTRLDAEGIYLGKASAEIKIAPTMYLALKNESTRTLALKRAWTLKNKSKDYSFSFLATLRENVHVSGSPGIRVHYTLVDFESENLTFPDSQTPHRVFEFILTDAGAISSDGPHQGHLADIVEDLRCAWITPELGLDGLRWTTEPGLNAKLPEPWRTFESVTEHRITHAEDDCLTVESQSELSLKLRPTVRMGPLHGCATQTTVLHKSSGPTSMQRKVQVILHDPNQREVLPSNIESSLSLVES